MKTDLTVAVRSAWERIERWCKLHHPPVLRKLNPGAPARKIKAVERAIGRDLPPDARESFALHDGGPECFLAGHDLLSTEGVIREWTNWGNAVHLNESSRRVMASTPANAIALDYFNPGWIPMLWDTATVAYLAVDLAPEPAGSVGQVINFGRNDGMKRVLASSWAQLLTDYATFLESVSSSDIDPDAQALSECYVEYLDRIHHDFINDGGWPQRAEAEPVSCPRNSKENPTPDGSI